MVIFAAKFAGRTLAWGLISFTVAGFLPVVGFGLAAALLVLGVAGTRQSWPETVTMPLLFTAVIAFLSAMLFIR